jgi:hypothetical protein
VKPHGAAMPFSAANPSPNSLQIKRRFTAARLVLGTRRNPDHGALRFLQNPRADRRLSTGMRHAQDKSGAVLALSQDVVLPLGGANEDDSRSWLFHTHGGRRAWTGRAHCRKKHSASPKNIWNAHSSEISRACNYFAPGGTA